LPEHAHLLAEPGCFLKRVNKVRTNRECGTGDDEQAKVESVLPEKVKPLPISQEQDKKWFELIKSKVVDKTEAGNQQKKEIEEGILRQARREEKKANATVTV